MKTYQIAQHLRWTSFCRETIPMKQQRFKRSWSQIEDVSSTSSDLPQKLRKAISMSALSDEIIVRILRHLAVPDLTLCQRVCRRLYQLAGDGQIWKELYLARFGSQISELTGKEFNATLLKNQYDCLSQDGTKFPDWQKTYRLQSRWSHGDCRLYNVVVNRPQSKPSSMIRIHGRAIVTVDDGLGVRVWRSVGSVWMIEANMPFTESTFLADRVVSLSISSVDQDGSTVCIAIGFLHGVAYIRHIKHTQTLDLHAAIPVCKGDQVVSMDSVFPFSVVMTRSGEIIVHQINMNDVEYLHNGNRFVSQSLNLEGQPSLYQPSVCLRRIKHSQLIISISYLVSAYQTSWSLGLQEIDLDLCRRPATGYGLPAGEDADLIGKVGATRVLNELIEMQTHTRPHLLAYNYPFLLTASADNTLSLFMVSSTENSVELQWREKLLGHTSQINAVCLDSNGRAVSVGGVGQDVHIWNLDSTSQCREPRLSTRLWPQTAQGKNRKTTRDFMSGASLPAADQISPRTTAIFDEEHIFVLARGCDDSKDILVYDFS